MLHSYNVMDFLEYGYMLPIAILIATIAMASGVEGATFFAPIFMLGLGLEPEVAVGVGLITEVFGFGSGLLAYVRRGLIDYQLGFQLLIFTIPMALLGTWAAGIIPAYMLQTVLGIGLSVLAISFLLTPEPQDVALLTPAIEQDSGNHQPESCLITADGEEIRYSIGNKTEGRILASVGGLFIGMVSTGLGELNGYFLLQRCNVPSKVAVASSVFVVAITALLASVGHAIQFAQAGNDVLNTVLRILTFTVPGVIIGGQIGPKVAELIPQHAMEKALGILFLFVSALMLGQVVWQSTG